MRERLADSYPFFHSAGREGRYAAERFAFASKTELSDVQFTPPEAGLFGFYSATMQFNGESIRLVNVI